jgi:hypothetical protein
MAQIKWRNVLIVAAVVSLAWYFLVRSGRKEQPSPVSGFGNANGNGNGNGNGCGQCYQGYPQVPGLQSLY